MNWHQHFARRAKQMKRTAVRELLQLTTQPGMISFAGGLPGPDLFPMKRIADAAKAVLRKVGPAALQYGHSEGVPELRDWIVQQHARDGVRVTRKNVLIVSGAQQGIDLIGRILLNQDDVVAVE